MDHIEPLVLGGMDHDLNLQTLCKDCDREKTTTDIKRIKEGDLNAS